MRLAPGAHVRVVSPAGPARSDRLEAGVRGLEALGFRVSLGRSVLARTGFLAGSDTQRLDDLHAAFADPDVDAVVVTRGGYGTQRLLDRLDRELLHQSRGVFVGFSDLTALHVVIYQECLRPSLYGSAMTVDANLRALLLDPSSWSVASDPAEPTYELTRGGSVHGPLLGGNLALLASAAGTRDALQPPPGSLLLLEDVREAPYRLDRMMLQLARAGTFHDVAGLVLGQFHLCTGPADGPTAVDVLGDWCDRLGVPVLGGVPVGHGPGHNTVPLGAVVDGAPGGTLRLAEAVTD